MKILLMSAAAVGIFGSIAMTSAASARTVCNDDGRCWHEDTNVGRDIARDLLTGRSAHRDHDWDRHRYDRDYDGPRDRGYDYDR